MLWSAAKNVCFSVAQRKYALNVYVGVDVLNGGLCTHSQKRYVKYISM